MRRRVRRMRDRGWCLCVSPPAAKGPFRSGDAAQGDEDAPLVPERSRLPLPDLDALRIAIGKRIQTVAEIDELSVRGLRNRLEDFRSGRRPGKLGTRGGAIDAPPRVTVSTAVGRGAVPCRLLGTGGRLRGEYPPSALLPRHG